MHPTADSPRAFRSQFASPDEDYASERAIRSPRLGLNDANTQRQAADECGCGELAHCCRLAEATAPKLYGVADAATHQERKYSPNVCTGMEVKTVSGDPDPDKISTSYVERQNLTLRMGMRRYTPLTNAFSKKIENLVQAVNVHYMHYNFAREDRGPSRCSTFKLTHYPERGEYKAAVEETFADRAARPRNCARALISVVVEWRASKVSYDVEVDMAYIRITEPEPGSSVKQVVVRDDDLPSQIVIDVDRDGRIRGFEVFDASQSLPLALLDEFGRSKLNADDASGP